MSIEWKVEVNDELNSGNALSEMNEITSVVWPERSDNMYLCGYKWVDPNGETDSYASMMKMDKDGDIKYLKRWGEGTNYKDMCNAIGYDEKKKEVIILLTVQSPNLRPSYNQY